MYYDTIINISFKKRKIYIKSSYSKEKYTKILKSGDNKQLVKLIRTLYLEKEKKKVEGKKLYVNDEKIMTNAEKLLHEEFALVLDIKVDEVLPFILGKLEVLQK